MSHDVVDLCSQLIAIDSINPFQVTEAPDGAIHIHGNEAAMLDFCQAYLQRAGFTTRRQDCGGGRQNLLAEKGDAADAILLYGHVDTVEVKQGWSREQALTPQRGRRLVDGQEEDVLYGLGSNDMKGGLAVLLQAAAQVEPVGYKLKVALGCDEEFWSLGSHCLVHDSDFLDDVGLVIVPEVGESTEDPEPGKWLVTLGRCGRTELIVDVPGTGGHGAEPNRDDRVNAVTQAAAIALAVEEYSRQMPACQPFPDSPQQVQASALVTRLEGGQGLLSIPDSAQIIVNRVLIPGETPESAQQDLYDLIQQLREVGAIRPVVLGQETRWPSVHIRPRPTPPLLPYLTEIEHPAIQVTLAILGEHIAYQIGMGVSVADENRFGAEAGKPVIVLGPRGEDAHAAYEWVSIPSLYQLEKLYIALLQRGQELVGSSIK